MNEKRSKTSKNADVVSDSVLAVKFDASNASSGNVSNFKKPALKVEMQTLYISQESEKLVFEALKKLHGPEFSLRDRSSFTDKGECLSRQYWMDRGNLVVQGGVDYSAQPRGVVDAWARISAFALARLQSYGFDKNHCNEALTVSNGDVGLALELLLSQYFKLGVSFSSLSLPGAPQNGNDSQSLSANDLEYIATQREEEKTVLESIYEKSFEERVPNRVWVVKLDLDYLLDLYKPVPRHRKRDDDDDEILIQNVSSRSRKQQDICRFYLKGQCRYTHTCKFLHQQPEPVQQKCDTDTEKYLFELEIRFPEGSRYPIEPALVCLSTNCPRFPPASSLRLSARLCREAREAAKIEQPCVYSLVQLLDQTDEMIAIVKGRCEVFLDPCKPLFPNNAEEVQNGESQEDCTGNKENVKQNSHKRGTAQISKRERLREDDDIAFRFRKKKSMPQYQSLLEHRKTLPAWSMKDDILETVRSNQVIVISGETGCGKSTQVPQFLLDEWLDQRDKGGGAHSFEIVCTQPRRLSTIGVAERVAEERVEKVGSVVGYQIRLESKMSSSTRLLFCTTGILLRRLESDPTLSSVTHIIVDEVHERSEESDFLLLILRDLLPQRRDLKIILMSATVNAELFANYFQNVPTIDIPGRTFPVTEFFLEDILEQTQYVLEENSVYARKLAKGHNVWENMEIDMVMSDKGGAGSVITNPATRDENLTITQLHYRYQDYSKLTCKTLFLMDPEKLNYELMESVILWIVNGEHEYPREGSILVFLPGIAEIMTLHDHLNDHPELGQRAGKFLLIPLHSSLSNEDQALVFKKPKPGVRKIVLSTNIAETSITIDDCVFVIDCGKMKENRFDSNKNMGSLELVWVSRANARQRKGRAGRVMPGVCVHLYSNHRFRYQFLAQPVPELHRVPLEQLLLRIMIMPIFKDSNVHEVLGRTMEPPPVESVDSSLVRLRDVGAVDEDLQLTPLGRHLAALPVDVRIGKLMLLGAIFCCLDSSLTIAACLSYKSPFVTPFSRKELADAKRKEFSVANSDQLTVLKAYKDWLKLCNISLRSGQNFAQENFLSWRTLLTLSDMKLQFFELLASIGFVPGDIQIPRRGNTVDKVAAYSGTQLNINGENNRLLVAILCAALYPNIVKVLTPEKSYAPSVVGAIPCDVRADELKFKTRDDGCVFLHPSSVNYTVNRYTSPYLVYQEKTRTSRIFIRDCSMVPVISLVLFSGCGLSVELNQGNFVLVLDDGWIKFLVDRHEVAQLLQGIREELVKLLEEKIEEPSLNLLTHAKGNIIISTIVHLVSKD